MNKVLPVDHEERLKAIDPSRSVIAIAPAGSGKTSVLVLRFLACMARCENPEEVLAITFTRKAAGEMQQRIVSALQSVEAGVQPTSDYETTLFEKARAVLDLDRARGWNILKNPARLRIYTIDRLNSLLANRLPLLSGLGGQGRIEENPELLYRDAVLNLFSEIEDEDVEPELRSSLERVLQFSRYQVESLSPLLEQLLATRDQWLPDVLNYDHSRSEAVLTTLIEGALARASEILTQCGGDVAVKAFIDGSGCHDKLRWASELNGIPAASITHLEHWRKLAGSLLTSTGTLKKRVTISDGFEAKRGYTESMKVWLSERAEDERTAVLERALADVRMLPCAEIPEVTVGFIEALQVVLLRLVGHLKIAFQQSGKVDFIEIAQRAIAALGDEETGYGDALLEEDRVKHILVDEKQDTSFSQLKLLECLMAGWEEGDDRTIFFCGDPQQSIYFWRGANVGLFVSLWESACFGVKQLERVQLSTNFRSNKPMVDWFNRVFSAVFPKVSDSVTGAVSYSNAHGFNENTDGGVSVHTHAAGDDAAEAARVVELVKDALDKNPENSVAVLVRGRSHLKSIIPALRAAGIPFTGQDIDKIGDNTPISDCIGLIRSQWHLADRVAWMTFLRSSLVGLSWADCLALSKGRKDSVLRDVLDEYQAITELSEEGKERIKKTVAVLRHVENSPRSDDLVWRSKALWHSLGGISTVGATEYQDIQRVFKLLASCCSGGQLESIYAFEKKLGGLFATPTAGHVEIMTIHKSKGLEFDTVILPGLDRRNASDQGQLMYWKSIHDAFLLAPQPLDDDVESERLYTFMRSLRSQEQSQEMLRTLYVAATRARKTLHLLTGVVVKEDQVQVEKNSFASVLMPVIESDVEAPEMADGVVDSQETDEGRHVLAPRLPVDYALPRTKGAYIPAWLKGEIPPETILRAELGKDDEYENLAARLVGIVYHHFMHRISVDGIDQWSDRRVQACRKAVVALMRRCGCPEEDVNDCVDRVIKLLVGTLNSSTGRWLLAAREHSRSEFTVSGRDESQWYTVVLDKTFKDNGTTWIVDYKTSALRGDKHRFIAFEWRRYKAKLEKYRSALQLAGVKGPIVTALYYPDIDEMVTDEMMGKVA